MEFQMLQNQSYELSKVDGGGGTTSLLYEVIKGNEATHPIPEVIEGNVNATCAAKKSVGKNDCSKRGLTCIFIISMTAILIITFACFLVLFVMIFEVKSDVTSVQQGLQAFQAQQVGGGITYIRWGRTTCPDTCGTSLVYSGRVAGSHFSFVGGAADYLCLPSNETSYFNITPGFGTDQSRQAKLFGAEYETGTLCGSLGPLGDSHHQHNVPCAVCATTDKEMKLMIPARTTCPEMWSVEYAGYLMTDSDNAEFHRTKFICVDRDAEIIPGTPANRDGALLYHVRVENCGSESLPCSAYDPSKELACVVCSK